MKQPVAPKKKRNPIPMSLLRRHRIFADDVRRVIAHLKAHGKITGNDVLSRPRLKKKKGADPSEEIPWSHAQLAGSWQQKDLKPGADNSSVLYAKEYDVWKLVVPEENVEKFLRKSVLDPKSKMPLSRDSAYHAVQKSTMGISRRALMGFLQKQAALQVTRNVPAERKKPGRPVEGKGYLELDLIEAKGRDISKFVHHYLRNFFWIMLVDRLTGWIEVERTTEKHAHIVSPLLKKMLKRMAAALKTDIKHIRSDRGGEFKAQTQTMLANLRVPHKFVKTGQRVEKANQDWQRTWYRLMRLGRGGHNELDAQAHAICNNIKSAVTGFTPLEALETDERVLKAAFNATRKRRTPYTAPEIKVGDKCRHIVEKVVGKYGRALDYKTYRGKHWSEVYTCTKISAETVHQPKKFYVGGEYRTRDKLLLVPGTDAATEAQIARRLHV